MYLSYLTDGKIQYEKCNIKFDTQCDFCVVGLGTAGSMAALAGAKYGLDTVGIERCSSIGGLGVNGGVFSYFYGSKNGLFTSINDRCYELSEHGYMKSVIDRRIEDAIPPALKSYALNEAADKYKCRIYTDTDVCGVYSEGRKIIGIKCIRNGKEINISAKVFVDCSSSAVLSRCFGCEMLPGREYDNEKMPYSKAIGTVSDYVMKDFSCGWWHYDYTHMPDKTDEMRISGTWSIFGMPRLSSPEAYCASILDCSSSSPCIDDTVKNRLYYLGCVPGEREAYHVRTERVLTLSDVVNQTKFTKPLFYTFAPLDCTNHDCGYESWLLQDWRYCVSDMGFSVGIEKEVLIAKDADNLIVAGKILGADHSIAGGVRMKADMEKCGEAAAALAFCSVTDKCSIRDVSYSHIAELLKKTKCLCDDDNFGFAKLNVSLNTQRQPYDFPNTQEAVKEEFKSPVADKSLWTAAYIWNDEKREIIKQWIKDGSDTFKINCACALGMSGSDCGKDILTDFVNRCEKAPAEALKGGKYSQYIKALSVCAKFGWVEIMPALEQTLMSGAVNIYPESYLKYRWITVSICMRAFETIYTKNPALRDKIRNFILSLPVQSDENMKRIYGDTPFLQNS